MSTPAPIVGAARDVIRLLGNVRLPEGSITNAMPDDLHKKPNSKGLTVLLRGLGEFIDSQQNITSVDANKPLVDRLKGADGKNVAVILSDIAIGDSSVTITSQLDEALKLRGRSTQDLFDAVILAVKNIARDKKLEIDELERDDTKPSPRPPVDQEKKDDENTWRASLHEQDDKKGPKVSDDYLRRAAADSQNIDDEAIKKSAGGDKPFDPGAAEKSAFERWEEKRAHNYHYAQMDEENQVQDYYELAARLQRVFKQLLGPALARGESPGR